MNVIDLGEDMTEVVWDLKFEDNQLKCGKVEWTISDFKTYKPSTKFKEIMSWVDVDTSVLNMKGVYKAFTDQYKITPTAALRSLSKQSYKHLVNAADPQVFKSCVFRGTVGRKVQPDLVDLWVNNREVVKLAYEDNQKTIIPLCIRLGVTPKQLKDFVGRSNWKKLLNNSLTRNNLIADWVRTRNGEWDNMLEIIDLPSTLMKYFGRAQSQELYAAARLGKEGRYVSNVAKLYDAYRLVNDTVALLEQLGKVANMSWSEKRWKEEHDKASQEITARKYSKEVFSHINYKGILASYEEEGFTATLLNSPSAVANEGQEMGHCVAGYSYYCSNGEYCVYSITDKITDERSTLGVTISSPPVPYPTPPVFRKQQHYGKFNKIVSEDCRLFGEKLVSELNKAGSPD